MYTTSRASIFIKFCLIALLTAPVSGGVLSTSGDVVEHSVPASLELDAFEAEGEIRLLTESENLTLSEAVTANVTLPSTCDAPEDLTPGEIPAGTTITSYLLHFDPVSDDTTASGSVTFDERILGLIILSDDLFATDGLLGAPGTAYPTNQFRGLGFGPNTTDDTITLGDDRRTVTVDCEVSCVLDQTRVVLPEPATLALLALGGLGVLVRRKRHKA